MTKSHEIIFNDVTLRDGEQAPGNTMTPEEKLAIAQQLVRMGIPAIEAGFPNSSQPDFESVQQIALEVGNTPLPNSERYPRISGLARLREDDIMRTIEAVRGAVRPGIHTFLSTSAIQVVKFDELIKRNGGTPRNMKDFVDKVAIPGIETLLPLILRELPNADIQFSPEDWGRTRDKGVGNEVILAAASNGATIINLPDTVGISIPEDIGERIRRVRNLLDKHGFQHVQIAWHGHNDTGMAAANAIQAMHAGAVQIETTILGIGERTGNISFESFLAALDASHGRHEELAHEMRKSPMTRVIYRWLCEHHWIRRGRIELTDTLVRAQVMDTARLLSEILDKPIPAEYPIVGANAFAHESGVHADGTLKGERAGVGNVYEVLEPERYGAERKIVIGQQAGWANLQEFMDKHDLPYRQKDRAIFTESMKSATASRRKGLSDKEVLEQIYYPTIINITGGAFITNVEENPTRVDERKSVTITDHDNQRLEGIATSPSEGEIDAIAQALRQIIPDVDVSDFSVKNKPGEAGSSATAVAIVTLKNGAEVTMSAECKDTERAGLLAVQKTFNALWAQNEYARMIESES